MGIDMKLATYYSVYKNIAEYSEMNPLNVATNFSTSSEFCFLPIVALNSCSIAGKIVL